MDDCQSTLLFLTALGALIAALGALAAAGFTLKAAKATSVAASGTAIQSCLERYIAIMKDKRQARESKNTNLAEEFYRELFDLHWNEFQLWHRRVIPNNVMESWAYIRKRNYRDDKIEFVDDNGDTKTIWYRDQWDQLTKEQEYFEPDDPFTTFMEEIHRQEIKRIDMKELRKKTRKWEK